MTIHPLLEDPSKEEPTTTFLSNWFNCWTAFMIKNSLLKFNRKQFRVLILKMAPYVQKDNSKIINKEEWVTTFFVALLLLGFPAETPDVFPIGFSVGSGGGLSGTSFKAEKILVLL